jgi:hypothetical protein
MLKITTNYYQNGPLTIVSDGVGAWKVSYAGKELGAVFHRPYGKWPYDRSLLGAILSNFFDRSIYEAVLCVTLCGGTPGYDIDPVGDFRERDYPDQMAMLKAAAELIVVSHDMREDSRELARAARRPRELVNPFNPPCDEASAVE